MIVIFVCNILTTLMSKGNDNDRCEFRYSRRLRSARLELNYYGVVAQLGERLNGIQEVRGSIPLSSTIKKACLYDGLFLFLDLLSYPLKLRKARFPGGEYLFESDDV